MIKNYFKTRRQLPRLKTSIPAIALSENGHDFPAVIQDFSPNSAQITYQGKKGALLYDKTANYDVLKNLKITLKFNLPYADHESIEIHAKPIHHHHLGNHKYDVGVIFDENDTEQKNKIMDYFSYEAGPTLNELKEIYTQKNIDIARHETHVNAEIATKDKNIKASNIDNNTEKPDIKYVLDHKLNMITTILGSLISSIKLIENKLDRIEKKVSK